MKKTLLLNIPSEIPSSLQGFIGKSKIYDSSCSTEARVYFIDRDGGYYLKRSPSGTLKAEAEMNAYFYKKGIGANVLEYISDGVDWLLTEAVRGDDCTSEKYLSDPKRLCDTVALELRRLHETDFSDCPIQDRMSEYVTTVETNYATGNFDASHFPDSFGYSSADEAWSVFSSGKDSFKREVLLHGDYCLPNIMLDDWRLSGFIDVGFGGVGDRHLDLFWGAWTLWFNLGTDEYRERFFDAYGRDVIDVEKIKTIAAAEVFV